jgi:hypothetical protein
VSYGEPTLDEQVEALFPLDGPYSEEETRAAARSIAELVRYLNHAAYSDRALPYPSTVDSLVGSLSAAVAGLDHLLRQSSDRLLALASREDAYDDKGGDPMMTAMAATDEMAAARDSIGSAQADLARVCQWTNRLGLDADRAARDRAAREG